MRVHRFFDFRRPWDVRYVAEVRVFSPKMAPVRHPNRHLVSHLSLSFACNIYVTNKAIGCGFSDRCGLRHPRMLV